MKEKKKAQQRLVLMVTHHHQIQRTAPSPLEEVGDMLLQKWKLTAVPQRPWAHQVHGGVCFSSHRGSQSDAHFFTILKNEPINRKKKKVNTFVALLCHTPSRDQLSLYLITLEDHIQQHGIERKGGKTRLWCVWGTAVGVLYNRLPARNQ